MSSADLKKQMQQALVVHSDVLGDMRTEIVDSIIGAVDKYTNAETAAKVIKEILDKQYGPTWQVVIGKGFAFEVTSLDNTMMHCFYQGDLGVLVYKS